MTPEELEAQVRDISVHLGVMDEKIQELEKRTGWDRFWDITTKVVAPALALVAAAVFNLHNRVSYMENTLIPPADLVKQLEALRATDQDLEGNKQALIRIETKVDSIDAKQDALKERVIMLEQKIK